MKFLVPNYSCLQNPWLGGYRPQFPVLSVLCPQLNLLNPPPRKKFLGTPLSVRNASYGHMTTALMAVPTLSLKLPVWWMRILKFVLKVYIFDNRLLRHFFSVSSKLLNQFTSVQILTAFYSCFLCCYITCLYFTAVDIMHLTNVVTKFYINPWATGLNFTCHLIILTLRLPD